MKDFIKTISSLSTGVEKLDFNNKDLQDSVIKMQAGQEAWKDFLFGKQPEGKKK